MKNPNLNGRQLMEFLFTLEKSTRLGLDGLGGMLGELITILTQHIVEVELNVMILVVLIRSGADLMQSSLIHGNVVVSTMVFEQLAMAKKITGSSLHVLDSALTDLYAANSNTMKEKDAKEMIILMNMIADRNRSDVGDLHEVAVFGVHERDGHIFRLSG